MGLFVLKLTFVALLLSLTAACSPRYNWRDVHDDTSGCMILMPARPSELSRAVQLGQHQVIMHMHVAQIDGVNFAVGTAQMGNATEAQATIAIIKNALLQNLAGHLAHEKTAVANIDGKITFNDEFDALKPVTAANPATRMLGRLAARGPWVFQLLVVGPEKDIDEEAAETFLNSFKPD